MMKEQSLGVPSNRQLLVHQVDDNLVCVCVCVSVCVCVFLCVCSAIGTMYINMFICIYCNTHMPSTGKAGIFTELG